MKGKIIELLKQNKKPEAVAKELGIDVRPPRRTDYYTILAICEACGVGSDEFNEIIDVTFDEIGLRTF